MLVLFLTFFVLQGVFLVLSKVIWFKKTLLWPKMIKGGSHFFAETWPFYLLKLDQYGFRNTSLRRYLNLIFLIFGLPYIKSLKCLCLKHFIGGILCAVDVGTRIFRFSCIETEKKRLITFQNSIFQWKPFKLLWRNYCTECMKCSICFFLPYEMVGLK